jgi:hypothetical protein
MALLGGGRGLLRYKPFTVWKTQCRLFSSILPFSAQRVMQSQKKVDRNDQIYHWEFFRIFLLYFFIFHLGRPKSTATGSECREATSGYLSSDSGFYSNRVGPKWGKKWKRSGKGKEKEKEKGRFHGPIRSPRYLNLRSENIRIQLELRSKDNYIMTASTRYV